MVVVVEKGVNGFEVGVVVVACLSSELIGKGMVRGEKHLLHIATLCVNKYGKVCANILRSMSTQHSPN
jgi:hypothetical protein